MEKKEFSKENNNIRKERFEFILKINDNIICQRFFKMYGFNEIVSSTLDLKYTIDDIVTLIEEDLKSKTRVYTWYNYDSKHIDNEFKIKPFSGIGDSFKYECVYNVTDINNNITEKIDTKTYYDKGKIINDVNTYIHQPENHFKFIFRVDDREVFSKIWSADEYPIFVRNNVDITNKKYSYDDADEKRMTFESLLLRKMSRRYDNGDKLDLIPIIIKKLCDVCTNKKNYILKLSYDDKIYNLLMHDSMECDVKSTRSNFRKTK